MSRVNLSIPINMTARRVFGKRWHAALAFIILNCLVVTCFASTYKLPSPGEHLIGHVQEVTANEGATLVDIARLFNLGIEEIRLANTNVDMWLPDGQQITLPGRIILPDAPRQGIVINIAEMRLYYFPEAVENEPAKVVTFPISIGRAAWRTPLKTTQVVAKLKNPAWYPPLSIRNEHAEMGKPLAAKIEPGPDNPLGEYALKLGLDGGYLIHGTNRPSGIGMKVTHGCLRLYPEDIKTIYEQAPLGTPVHIVNQPYKAGWSQQKLYIEAHPDPLDDPSLHYLTDAVRVVVKATQNKSGYAIDWQKVIATVRAANGIPAKVSLPP